MTKFIISFSAIAIMIATYIYLDWSFLQILGVCFVLIAAHTADEKGPVWRRGLLVSLVFTLMVLGHFVIDDNLMYWGALVVSCILFIVSIYSLNFLFTAKPGAGSVLTMALLGVIICFPTAIYVTYLGLNGLGYW